MKAQSTVPGRFLRHDRMLAAREFLGGCLGCLPWLAIGGVILATIVRVWWPR